MNLRTAFLAPLCAILAACAGEQTSAASAADPTKDQQQSSWRIATSGDLNLFFDCVDEAGGALVSAHRGGPAPGLPENALETLQATLAAAPALMEVDVATSADGVLFLLHDDTLDRTTTGAGVAADTPWAQIADLNLKDASGAVTDFTPPRFSDTLAWSKSRTILKVDFKRSTRYEDVIDEVIRQDAEDRVVLIAYSMAAAERLHRLAPNTMISLSLNTRSDLNRAIAAGVPENRILGFTGTREINSRLLAQLDDRSVEGIFGTLGRSDSIDNEIARSGDNSRYVEIAEAGVDIIATDRPRAAYDALAAAGRDGVNAGCGLQRASF